MVLYEYACVLRLSHKLIGLFFTSLSLFLKCLKDYEISGFIEMNCNKLHIDLIQLIVK